MRRSAGDSGVDFGRRVAIAFPPAATLCERASAYSSPSSSLSFNCAPFYHQNPGESTAGQWGQRNKPVRRLSGHIRKAFGRGWVEGGSGGHLAQQVEPATSGGGGFDGRRAWRGTAGVEERVQSAEETIRYRVEGVGQQAVAVEQQLSEKGHVQKGQYMGRTAPTLGAGGH